MTNLAANTLRAFPVRYPRHMIATGEEPQLEWTKKRRRRRPGQSEYCWTRITFRDDFAGPRGSVQHHAIDIFGVFELEIVATTSGMVPETWPAWLGSRRVDKPGVGTAAPGETTGGGNYAMIRDENGVYHYYAHLSSPPRLNVGDRVQAGQLIGYLGDSGASRPTCQHLHYQTSTREQRDPPGRGWAITYLNPYRELLRIAAASRMRIRRCVDWERDRRMGYVEIPVA